MREIEVSVLTDVVERLCIAANEHLPSDVKEAIRTCRACEDGEIAKGVLDNIIENFEIADSENVPICQDTGMACVFLEIGQDVHFTGGDLTDAVNEGVRRGYDKGYLRKSVVKDPIRRGNTGDNTPAMLYTEIVPGEQVKVTVGPKGRCRCNPGNSRRRSASAPLWYAGRYTPMFQAGSRLQCKFPAGSRSARSGSAGSPFPTHKRKPAAAWHLQCFLPCRTVRRTSFRSSPAKFYPWWETDSNSFPLLRPLRPRSD